MKNCFVGIDTSNYTTSLAVCGENGELLLNLRKLLSVKEGERGLRQSDAVFEHIRNMPEHTENARELLSHYHVCAVACSSKPRDAAESYMPCFLAGKNTACAMASVLGVPMYEFSHQNGHIMAAAYSSGRSEELLRAPFCAFHISGGTTEILRVVPTFDERIFTAELVGGTRDLNAGQAVDRTGVLMGLRFPCGKEMEALASEYCGRVPSPKISVSGLYCNLSGLESLAAKLYTETQDKKLTSRFVLDFLAKTFIRMTEGLLEVYPNTPLLYAGGVMSNKYLQARIGESFSASFAAPDLSADNAAGIALLCRKRYNLCHNACQ